MKQLVPKIRSKLSGLHIPTAVVGAISLASASTSAFAMSWPPTAADLATAFGDVATLIGEIFAVAVTAGLVIYGGYLAVNVAIRFFSKFIMRVTSS